MVGRNNNLDFYIYILIFIFSINMIATGSDVPPEYELMAENQYLSLYLNCDTTEIAIRDKRSDDIWYSNPPGAKGSKKAQFSITYYAPGDVKKNMNNYNDSIKYDQYKIESADKGVRINYVLGQEWRDQDYMPIFINEERLNDNVIDHLEDKDKRDIFYNNYHLISLEKADPEKEYEDISIYQVDEEAVFRDYIITVSGKEVGRKKQEEFMELLLEHIVENKSGLDDWSEITHQDIIPFIETPTYIQGDVISAWDRDDLIDLFKNVNYTPEQVGLDHSQYQIDPPYPNIRVFSIPVEYRLEGESFIAKIPTKEIEYPVNVVNEEGLKDSFPLTQIRFLEYFGAADTDAEGYMLVPDGSGALINLNNKKGDVNRYNQPVYGNDYTKSKPQDFYRGDQDAYQNRRHNEQIHLPVYGLKKEDKAFLAIIESGETVSRIVADIAREANDYNQVYANFNILPFAEVYIDNPDIYLGFLSGADVKKYMNVYQKEKISKNLKIQYKFLKEENASYTGMADNYRQYLIQKYNLTDKEISEDLPFALSLVGAITTQKPVMGMPREVIKPVTTFNQVEVILEKLIAKDIKTINLHYEGWLKGGIRHNYPDSVNLEKGLGTKKEFINLVNFINNNKNEINFYPEVTFINIYHNKLFDGFNPRRHASRKLDRSIAEYPSVYGDDVYILSPKELSSLTNKFISDYNKLELENIAINKMGVNLNSDFKEDPCSYADREQAKTIIEKQLDEMNKKYDLNLLLSGGNEYTAVKSKNLLEAPLFDSEFKIVNKTVPFFQMVFHGLIDYAGEPINFAQHNKKNMLKTVETGAVPYYKGFYQEGEVVKETKYNYLYTGNYNQWLEEAVNFYHKANKVLSKVRGEQIIEHREIENKVFKTIFANNKAIIVNYNSHQVEIDGQILKAKSFALIED